MIKRRRSARWLVVLVAALAVVLGISNSALARTTSTDVGSFTYDAPAATLVDARAFSDATAGGTQLGGALERHASPSRPAQGASTTPAITFVATEAVPGGVDTGMIHGPPLGRPNFVANANGEIVPVPEGAVGPTMVDSGKGFQFTGGSGGRGLNPRVTDVRIMDPVTSGKYTYPDGYVSYSNGATPPQTVNPWTGQTVANADPWAHWPWGPK